MDPKGSESRKNGQQIGAEYLNALTMYLAALKFGGHGLPAIKGKISIAAISLAAGVDKQSLYKNRHCRELLEKAAQELGLNSISVHAKVDNQEGIKDQRIMILEQQVGTLQAEIHGLRERLKKFEYIEMHIVETGRRVIP